MNIFIYLGGVDLLFSCSLNVNRLRLGMVCSGSVARNAEFLTLIVELGIGAPYLGSERHSPLLPSFLFLPFLPSKGSDYFLGHSIPLAKARSKQRSMISIFAHSYCFIL